MLRRFQDLHVWQEARALSLRVYGCSEAGLLGRDWGLRDQMRRAAVSVMSNLAEGFARYSPKDFRRFVGIARGSLAELRSHLSLADGLKFIDPTEYGELDHACEQLYQHLNSLHASIKIQSRDRSR